MNLADRIRGVVGRSTGGSAEPTSASAEPALRTTEVPHPPYVRRPGSAVPPVGSAYPAEIRLGGERREWHGHPYVVIDRTYPPGYRHGDVAVADSVPGQGGAWPVLSVLEPALARAGRVLFVDLETTGLAGGAGTYAFLIGCGWFEDATFRVRQFLLAAYPAERGLLQELAGAAGGAGAVATYNGKTFDLPLIEMRCLFHRMATPFAGMPHVDMLHSARRLWGARRPGSAVRTVGPADPAASADPASCRLSWIEQSVLGHVREGDVPGFEIPSRYFHYVRSGDARPLAGVIEHNRLDLLSLAMLTARAAQLLEQGADAARTAREALGLGGLYLRRGMQPQARACFVRAAEMEHGGDMLTRAEALRAYAVVCRRSGDYEEAAQAWRRILDLSPSVPHLMQEAHDALAVHHEHRLRDFRVAHEFALQSLVFSVTASRVEAARHRVARLHRKLGLFPLVTGEPDKARATGLGRIPLPGTDRGPYFGGDTPLWRRHPEGWRHVWLN